MRRLGFVYKKPRTLPAQADEAKQAAFIAKYETLMMGPSFPYGVLSPSLAFMIASKTSGHAPATLSEANLTRSLFVLILDDINIIVLESNLLTPLLYKHQQCSSVVLHQMHKHLSSLLE